MKLRCRLGLHPNYEIRGAQPMAKTAIRISDGKETPMGQVTEVLRVCVHCGMPSTVVLTGIWTLKQVHFAGLEK